MEALTTLRSQIVPIPRTDIDTDLIVPAKYLKGTQKTGLGSYLFARLREAEPDFPLNRPRYDGARILVARANFGCGSSREHAPWALADHGFRVIVAPSFADIFYSNALKNGILPIVLDASVVERIFEAESRSESYAMEVDLPRQTVTLPTGEEHPFAIDPYRKTCLLGGMDDLDYLLSRRDVIERYERQGAMRLFFGTGTLR